MNQQTYICYKLRRLVTDAVVSNQPCETLDSLVTEARRIADSLNLDSQACSSNIGTNSPAAACNYMKAFVELRAIYTSVVVDIKTSDFTTDLQTGLERMQIMTARANSAVSLCVQTIHSHQIPKLLSPVFNWILLSCISCLFLGLARLPRECGPTCRPWIKRGLEALQSMPSSRFMSRHLPGLLGMLKKDLEAGQYKVSSLALCADERSQAENLFTEVSDKRKLWQSEPVDYHFPSQVFESIDWEAVHSFLLMTEDMQA